MSKLMNDREAADYLGMRPTTLRHSRWSNELAGAETPKFIKLGRSVRYRKDDLDMWVEAQNRRSKDVDKRKPSPSAERPKKGQKPNATSSSSRDKFAMAAMQGMLAWGGIERASAHDYARWSVAQADALLAELERTGGGS